MEKLKVYSKENCVQCTATDRKINELGIEIDYFSLEDHPEKVAEFREKGLMQAPVVEASGEFWSGYRPDKLAEYALKNTIEYRD